MADSEGRHESEIDARHIFLEYENKVGVNILGLCNNTLCNLICCEQKPNGC